MKNLFALSLALFVILSGCKKDDDPQVSSEEAKAKLMAIGDDLSQEMTEMRQSEGATSLTTLMDFASASSDFGQLNVRMGAINQLGTLTQLLGSKRATPATEMRTASSDIPWGIYEWDATEQDFVLTESSNILVLKFPFGESETNNGIFTLSKFDRDANDQPVSVRATLTVDGESFVNFSLDAGWTENGDPEFVDLSLYLKPYTISLLFDNRSNVTELQASIGTTAETIISFGLRVNYTSTEKLLPKKITGYFQYRILKIDGMVDVMAAIQSQGTDPNEFIELKVFVENEQIGKIIFIPSDSQEEDNFGFEPYIKYTDGTMEPLNELFGDLFGEVLDAL